MITSTDHFEVATRATFAIAAGLAVHRGAEPGSTEHDLMVLLSATIAPSDLPAAELPDYEPTADDLLAIELFNDSTIDELVESANTLSAYEANRRARLGLPSDGNYPTTTVGHPTNPLKTMERAA
jgi:hypothetical protein